MQKRVTDEVLGHLENAVVEHEGRRVGSWDRDGDGALDYAEFEFGAPYRRPANPRAWVHSVEFAIRFSGGAVQ